jgi:S-layer family protein
VWASSNAGSVGVFKRAFDPAGRPVGPVDRVTSVSAGLPAIGTEDSSRLVIAWHAPWLIPPQDVWARRYDRLDGAGMVADPAATPGSDGNAVVEAGETVTVAPSWANLQSGVLAFAGVATNFSGPGGPGNPAYSIVDGSADYGPIPGGGTGGCEDSTPDCHRLSISVPSVRPTLHWDAAFDESLLPSSEHGGRTWSLHVGESFTDVARGSPFYRFVETLLHRGVTGGCGGSSYCPLSSTTREQMAVFALLGKEGSGYTPPACVAPNTFDDVPDTSPFCPWIEELARRGVVAGCGPGLYCPSASVSREQMAVFVLRTLDQTLIPAACAPPNLFLDVPETSPFCPWIEELARRGVVGGCGNGLFCPTASVTREQMAVFIGATFGLTLYGP